MKDRINRVLLVMILAVGVGILAVGLMILARMEQPTTRAAEPGRLEGAPTARAEDSDAGTPDGGEDASVKAPEVGPAPAGAPATEEERDAREQLRKEFGELPSGFGRRMREVDREHGIRWHRPDKARRLQAELGPKLTAHYAWAAAMILLETEFSDLTLGYQIQHTRGEPRPTEKGTVILKRPRKSRWVSDEGRIIITDGHRSRTSKAVQGPVPTSSLEQVFKVASLVLHGDLKTLRQVFHVTDRPERPDHLQWARWFLEMRHRKKPFTLSPRVGAATYNLIRSVQITVAPYRLDQITVRLHTGYVARITLDHRTASKNSGYSDSLFEL